MFLVSDRVLLTFTPMKTFFRSLTRFKSASLLNVLGLTIAFASFLLIMMQVRYEMNYDKGYTTAGKLYWLNPVAAPGSKLHSTSPRPLSTQLDSLFPAIEAITFRQGWDDDMAFYPAGTSFHDAAVTAPTFIANGTFPEVFGLELVSGSFDNFNRPKTAVVAERPARKIFRDRNPVGQTLIMLSPYGADTVEVVALYRDLPVNSSTPNAVIRHIDNENQQQWGSWNYHTYLTISDPEQIPQIERKASELLRSHAKWFYDEAPEDFCGVRLTKLSDHYFSPDNQEPNKGNLTTQYSMIAIAVLIVLVAMINFINFSLALVPRRIRNINTRKVLGSTRLSLCLQQLGEMLGITLLSAGLALLAVYYLSTTSFASLIDADMSFAVNLPLVWMTVGIAVATALLSGIYPALYSTSFPPALVLKGSFGLSAQGRRLRTGLIGFQYVVSLALIIVALFIHVQYRYMRDYDVGFQRDDIFTTWITMPMNAQKNALTDKLKTLPGVVDVAYSNMPIHQVGSNVSRKYKDKRYSFDLIFVSSNLLSVLGIPVVEGRDFIQGDELKPGSYIFNQQAQKKMGFQAGEFVEGLNGSSKPTEVVGVAHDFNYRPLHYPIAPLALYIGQDNWGPSLYAYIRLAGNHNAETMEAIRQTLLEFDPDTGVIATTVIQPLDRSVGGQYEKEDRQASLITLFSLLAVLISTVGAFGLIMFETQYRRKEIGVRKVFGATVADILRMFNRRYVWIVGICFLIAAPVAAYAALQWRNNFSYQAPLAGWIFGAALLIVLLITVSTVMLQSYRAATENPAHSVKTE